MCQNYEQLLTLDEDELQMVTIINFMFKEVYNFYCLYFVLSMQCFWFLSGIFLYLEQISQLNETARSVP